MGNALQLKHLIQGITPEAPEALVADYPEWADVVSSKRKRLF